MDPIPPLAAIAIVCKTPRPGASKTRLAALVGADAAASLSACFIRDVAASIEAVPAAIGRRGHALFAPVGSEDALRPLLPAGWGLTCRADTDFGAVLFDGMAGYLAAGHDCALIVNSDSPTLAPLLLTAAVAALRAPGDRLVLGPASDGGYYLVGMKQPHRRVFEDIAWSTSAVLPTTLERAAEIGLPVTLLPMWYDIDDAATLAMLEAELAGSPPAFATALGGPAAATRAFLASRPPA